MKKENIISVVIYLVVFAVAIIYGFTALQTHYTHSSIHSVALYAVYIIVSIIAGLLSTAFLQEIGHLLGAKVGGYTIMSWCMIYFTFYRDQNKYKFKFASFDGLTGETKISPNYKKKENPNPYPYLLYGTIFNAAWIAACFFLFMSFKNDTGFNSDLAYFFLTIGVITLICTIYNIVPVKLDSMTDGYRLTQIKKDVANFNKLLAAENGTHDEAEENKEEEDENKPTKFIPEVALNKVYVKFEEENYEEAKALLDEIFEHEKELNGRLELDAKAQIIYLKVMSEDLESVKAYYESDVSFSMRRELANDNSLPVIRTYILTAGLFDGSQSEVLLSLKKVLKAYKNIPSNRKHTESVLFNRALDKVIAAHPKWEEIQNYKIYE